MADVQRGKEARGKKKHIEVNGADLMRGTAGGALSHGAERRRRAGGRRGSEGCAMAPPTGRRRSSAGPAALGRRMGGGNVGAGVAEGTLTPLLLPFPGWQ